MSRMNASLAAGTPTKRERGWATACHRLFTVCQLASPFAGSWGPLLFLVSLAVTGGLAWRGRATSSFVAEHARESLQFQLIVVAVFLAAYCVNRVQPGPDNPTVLVIVVVGTEIGALCLSWIAAERASLGAAYRYPVSLRIGR